MNQMNLFDTYEPLPLGSLDVNLNVRALSWKQPFAELMLPPFNKIETRVWHTNYRGLVLICASKQPYSEMQLIGISGEIQTQRIFNTLNSRRQPERTGQAIGIGYLVDCRPMRKEDEDKCFVKYYPDLYCHIYQHVTPIQCIEWKGKQGWSTLSNEVKQKIIIEYGK